MFQGFIMTPLTLPCLRQNLKLCCKCTYIQLQIKKNQSPRHKNDIQQNNSTKIILKKNKNIYMYYQ